MGSDKFQVLLLSVDLGYGENKDTVAKENLDHIHEQNANWPNVLLANGFDDCQRQFNLDGYGLTLISPDGIVRGVDVRPEEVRKLLWNLDVNLDN